jgi:ribosomal protein S18 acetylase RimI-like enzyme
MEQKLAASFEVHFSAMHPDCHRRGIGRLLRTHLEGEARARGGRWHCLPQRRRLSTVRNRM